MDAPIIDLCIPKGKTFEFGLMYASDLQVHIPIAAIPSLAPVRLTVPNHGMPDGWPFDIQSMRRPEQLVGEGFIATVIDANTIELNHLVAGTDWRPWTGDGVVSYLKPADIIGWSARAMFRRRINDPDPVLFFHADPEQSPDGLFLVEPAISTFTLKLDAERAEKLTAMSGVWDAEAIDPHGRVYPLTARSPFVIDEESTR